MANSTISCNAGAYTLVGAASVAVWVLGVASGSYAVTGSTVNLVRGHPITAVSGVYTLTGTAIKTRRIAIEPAGYILNGSAVTLSKTNKPSLTVASGSYSITGTVATKIEHGTPYTKGVYSLTGTVVTLTRSSANFKIPINSGVYTVTGTPVNLLSTVTIATGDYQIAGSTVTFRKGKSLPIGSGAYILSSNISTRLEQSRHFPSLSGSYSITGAITTLRYSNSLAIFIVINNGLYTFTGTPANLLMARRLVATGGTYIVTGGHTVFKKQYDSGVYSLVGSPVSFTQTTRRLTAAPGSYTISGQSSNLVYSIHRLVLDPGVYLLASTVTTTQKAYLLSNSGGLYSFNGSSINLRATQIVASPGIYSISDGGTALKASRVGRWRNQSRRPAIATPQPSVTDTWDPQQGAAGV